MRSTSASSQLRRSIADHTEGGRVKWLVGDQLGTPRMVIDQSGDLAGTNQVIRQDYLPFGEGIYVGLRQRGGIGQYGYEPPQSNVRQRFASKERDAETNLDFFGARYYASSHGRFTTPDPYMPSAQVDEPQSWNRYAYALNNPLKYVDPDGLDYEHLQGRQKELIDEWARRQNEQNKTNYTAQQLYDNLSESQRATYESVTHALMNTQLVDKDGKSLGNALDLVKSIETIAGDEKGKGSDEKFRVYGTLKENATSILKEAKEMKIGENSIYHGEYKLSFRQERDKGKKGLEAGFQVSATRDGRLGDIDVDYRFGLSHLGADNSDVRAKGNYQKHIDRWPGLVNWWDKKSEKKK